MKYSIVLRLPLPAANGPADFCMRLFHLTFIPFLIMASTLDTSRLLPPVEARVQALTQSFHLIPEERKPILQSLASFVQQKRDAAEPVLLVFICTHNSRRSHISQIWAQTAAAYYGVSDVRSYSGGTEATAFNPRAVRALQQAGFRIESSATGPNPRYSVFFSHEASPVMAYSKKFDAPENPSTAFAAVMTCSHADENCPVVWGAAARISLPYDDPKDFDGTPQEEAKYAERVADIGREILYAFSLVK